MFVETAGGGLTDTSLETLRFARDLAPDGQVEAIGRGLAAHAQLLGRHGVRTAHDLAGPDFEAWAAAAAAQAVIETGAAAAVITAAGTQRGNEVLAHVATRLDVAFAANAVAVQSRDPLVVTRQVMGGGAWEELRLGHTPAVFSVAGHAVEAVAVDGPAAEVIAVTTRPEAADLVARVAQTSPGEGGSTRGLRSARLVVGAGRGAGGPDGFGDVQELAALLGGVVGVSRVVTSLGWRPHHEQVGQTGSRIAPDLYVACGISGAIQHWAGCSSAKAILAVNTDEDAPLVTKATYAVVGDMHEVLPAVIEEVRARRG